MQISNMRQASSFGRGPKTTSSSSRAGGRNPLPFSSFPSKPATAFLPRTRQGPPPPAAAAAAAAGGAVSAKPFPEHRPSLFQLSQRHSSKNSTLIPSAKKKGGKGGGGGASGGSSGGKGGGGGGGGQKLKSPGDVRQGSAYTQETRKIILSLEKIRKVTPAGKEILKNVGLGMYLVSFGVSFFKGFLALWGGVGAGKGDKGVKRKGW